MNDPATNPSNVVYGAAKAALVNLTRVLGYEVGKDRVAAFQAVEQLDDPVAALPARRALAA